MEQDANWILFSAIFQSMNNSMKKKINEKPTTRVQIHHQHQTEKRPRSAPDGELGETVKL
jgi:hypothetical protein